MADFKNQKKGKSHVQNMGIFLAVQDMVLSHRAKFQLIVIFFVRKLLPRTIRFKDNLWSVKYVIKVLRVRFDSRMDNESFTAFS